MRPYPALQKTDPKSFKEWIDFVTRERVTDSNFSNSLPNTYIAGRRVTKIPANSSDITGSFPGDFNITSTFSYSCINSAGTVQWVRSAVSTF